MDLNAFIEEETYKRDALRPFSRGHVFASHSSRNPFTQSRKMELVAAISSGDRGEGIVYWADFLDLWNTGSVNWRQKIETAIETCTKLVAFVDREFLRSFNSVTEVISAMDKGKMVVPVILDDESSELLSAPDGAERVWASSPDFASYGDTVLFNVRLDFERFRRWWFEFSSINYILCRDQDFERAGSDYVVSAFKRAVAEDIRARERENFFNNKVLFWNAAGRAVDYLLPKGEVALWEHFISSSKNVTPLQRIFVAESAAHHAKKARHKRIAVWTSFSTLAALLCASTSLFAFAMMSRAEAQRERDRALENLQLSQALVLLGDADPLLPWRRWDILQGLRLLGGRLLALSFAADVLERIGSYAFLSSEHAGKGGRATHVAVSSDGDSFASAADNIVQIRRLRDSGFLYEVAGYSEIECDGPVNRIKYADGDTLLVATEGASCNSTSETRDFVFVRAADVAAGDTGIASVLGNRVSVAPANGGPTRAWPAFTEPAGAELRSVAWLGDLVVVGGTDETIRMFRQDGTLVSAYNVGEDVNDIQTLDGAGAGAGVAVAALDEGVCQVFGANSTKRVVVFDDKQDAEAVAPAPGGFIVVNGEGQVRTVSLEGTLAVGADISVKRSLASVSSSPRRFALGGEFRDPIIFTRFDGFGDRGPLARTFAPCADGRVRSAATTSSRPLLVAAGTYSGTVCAWDAVSGEPRGVTSPSSGAKRALAFDPKGVLLAAGADGEEGAPPGVHLLAVPGLSPVRFFPTKNHTRDLAWLGDARRVVAGTTGSADNVYIFDAETGESRVLPGHDGRVRGLAASGNRFASSGNDGAVRVWDGDAAVLVREELFPRVQVSLLLLPDGAIVAGGEDGAVTEIALNGVARADPAVHSSKVGGIFQAGGVRVTTAGEIALRAGSDDVVINRFCRWAGLAAKNRLFCANSDANEFTASYILLDREQAVQLVEDTVFFS